MPQLFTPEQFYLDPNPAGLELDTDVAAHIANEVYDNSRSSRQARRGRVIGDFQIDPTGVLPAAASQNGAGFNCLASFLVDPNYLEESNGDFGSAALEAFDVAERDSRVKAKTSLHDMAIALAAGAAAEGTMITTGDAAAELIMGGLMAIANSAIDLPAAHNLYRRAITNPDFKSFYTGRLRLASKVAGNLSLPPLLAKI